MQRRQKFEIKGVMIQYNTRVETQSQMITKEASDWMGIMFYGDDRAQKC